MGDMMFEISERGRPVFRYAITGYLHGPLDRPTINRAEFPLICKVWGFKTTGVHWRKVPQLREEIERLLVWAREFDQGEAEGLPAVIELMKVAEEERLSVIVSGP